MKKAMIALILALAAAANSRAVTVGNSGFETPSVGAGSYSYRPSGATWVFTGNAGISGTGSPFTSGLNAPPDGAQVAFLQQTGNFTQAVSFASGTYVVTFRAAQRNGNQNQDFQVFVDSDLLGTFKPSSGAAYGSFTSSNLMVSAGNHAIRFVGKNTAGGDNTAVIDSVAVTQTGAAIAMTNSDPSAVTASSASMNGILVTNAGTAPRVMVLWGMSDGGTNLAAWANTNDFGANAQPLPVSYGTNITGLSSNTLYVYRYCATNDSGEAWGSPTKSLVTGGVGIQCASGASERGLVAGAFTVYRPAAATNVPLTLTYAQTGGTAAAGTNFTALSGSVTIPAGAATASIPILPLWDTGNPNDTTLELTLTSASCAYDSASATMTIANVNGRIWAATTGNWADPAKWSPAGVPAAGDYVAVTNAGAYVTLSNQTEWLETLLLSNAATLFFTNYDTNTTVCLRATNVSVHGTVTQAVNTATTTNVLGQWVANSRIFFACSNFTLGAGGKINGNGCGFGAPSSAVDGYGPGGGKYNGFRPGGGGHGGRGATGGSGGAGGLPYGSATNPVQPGSGGGYLTSGNPSGAGGGLVRIEASGRVTVNGAVTVNGNSGGGGGAGGSGGGVCIVCNTLAGTGSIAANGGNGGGGDVNTGGGGGGRIAIVYDPVAESSVMPQPTVSFSASPSVTSASADAQPRPGTLYLSDASFFPYPVSLGCQIANPASTSCVMANLTVTNDSLLIFPTGTVLQIAGNLSVSGKGGIEVPYGSIAVGTNATFGTAAAPFGSVIRLASSGAVTVGGKLTVNTGPLSVYGDATNLAAISVGGDFVATNGGKFYLYCGATNAAMTNGSALVTVGGDMTVGSGSWIYPASHSVNGGSALFRVSNLNLLSGGGFNADGLGYGSPSVVGRGYGPGGGGYTANRGGGAGYGGTGGIAEATAGTGGPTYGSSNAPVEPGSGGGSHGGGGNSGGAGGGLVRIEAGGTVTIAGSITANGTGTAAGGGGSGGGIYIRCQATAGAGSLSANGGAGLNNSGFIAGNGGGGRVALTDWASDAFSGTIAVNPGTGSGNAGKTGTVVRAINAAFTMMAVAGSPEQHGTPSPYVYGNHGVFIGAEVTNAVNSPADQAGGVRYSCIGWTVTNRTDPLYFTNGAGTQAVFQVTSNLVQTWLWTNEWQLTLSSGPNGYLVANPGGWYTNGVGVPVSAVASGGYYFVQWTGVGAPADATNSSPTLVMDRVRTLQANFASLTPGSKTWTGTGNWANPANWTPPGMPGAEDTVTVASGTATLSDSITVAALRITNAATLILTNAALACAGDLTLTNTAKLYVIGGPASGVSTNCGTRVEVAGDMTVAPGTWVFPTSHPTNGGSPFFRMRNLSVLAGGGFDANGRGFIHRTGAAVAGRGPGGGGAGGYRSGGGGYGGRGGCPAGVTGGNTYGSSNAPVDCGSAAGNHEYGNDGGDGGGLIHITASSDVTLYGTLRANGTDGVGGSGGGSGGGVYLYCRKLAGGGPISANGGAGVNSDAGAGGGGRIAIWAVNWADYAGTVTKTKGAQWYGEDGTLVWKALALPGTVMMLR